MMITSIGKKHTNNNNFTSNILRQIEKLVVAKIIRSNSFPNGRAVRKTQEAVIVITEDDGDELVIEFLLPPTNPITNLLYKQHCLRRSGFRRGLE
jgi:hypothetical protein